ncbi:MAG: proteasome subunit alpha, partial [Thermoplasmata archaeon]
GRDAAIEYFEEHYKEGMNMKEAVELGLRALMHATEKKLEKEAVEIGIIEKSKEFRILPKKEVEKYFEEVAGEE